MLANRLLRIARAELVGSSMGGVETMQWAVSYPVWSADSMSRLLARSTLRTAARAGALCRAGYLAMRQNEDTLAIPHFEEALEIWRELGDQPCPLPPRGSMP